MSSICNKSCKSIRKSISILSPTPLKSCFPLQPPIYLIEPTSALPKCKNELHLVKKSMPFEPVLFPTFPIFPLKNIFPIFPILNQYCSPYFPYFPSRTFTALNVRGSVDQWISGSVDQWSRPRHFHVISTSFPRHFHLISTCPTRKSFMTQSFSHILFPILF